MSVVENRTLKDVLSTVVDQADHLLSVRWMNFDL